MWQTFGFFLGMLSTGSSLKIKNDVGRLPALGWNSWNAYEDKINEALFLQAADKLVQLGLKDAGYVYVNIDDCWQVKDHRDYSTNRLIPDPVKFPNGIKGLADKIHQMGLKLGIYSSAGTLTCAGYQASIGYESIDAATWADWGIDYLKYDNCNVPQNWTDTCRGCVPEEAVGQKPTGRVGPNGTCLDLGSNACPPDYDYSQSNTAERFRIMRDAILAQDRPMLYSLCEWGEAGVQQWGPSTGSSWRMSGDIKANWPRIMEILNENSFYLNNVDFYGHPDADMLEVGNGDLTIQESRSHFALWAAMKSPLLIGTDLNKLTPEVAAILGNKPLLAFNQDNVYGKPAMPFKWDWSFNSTHPAEYWSGNSQAGTLVLVLNTQDTPVNKTVYWSEVPELNGKGDAFRAVDVWSGQDIGCMQWGFEVEVATHDTQGLIVGEPCQKTSGGPKAVTHLQQSSGATSSSKRSLRGPKFFGLW